MHILFEPHRTYDSDRQMYIDGRRVRGGIIAGLFITGIIVAVSFIVFGIQKWATYSSHTYCTKFGATSSLQTEFVQFGFWSHECYVIMPDGIKLPEGKVIFNLNNG